MLFGLSRTLAEEEVKSKQCNRCAGGGDEMPAVRSLQAARRGEEPERERGWVIFGSVQINGDRTTEQGTRQGREGGKAEGGRSPERGARERETRRGEKYNLVSSYI